MASRIRLRGPAEVISAMPYLLGFHPTESLVALGLRGSGLHLQLRGDLPDDGDAGEVLAEHYARLFRRNGIDGALLIGYGPPARAEPFLRAVGAALTGRGITLIDMLRTHEGRYWSLQCEAVGCCPPEGRPFDPQTSIAAAEATLAGMVALPDRDAVAAGFAGPAGPALAAMEEAGNRANLRVLRLVAGRDKAGVRAAVVAAGRAALEAALTRYAAGGRLTDDEVAWLQVLLHVIAFRDRAWERLDRDVRRAPDLAEAHRLLWTDLVRRCEPCCAAPPATLLSYWSWRAGNGLVASIALDRALDADPGYSAAGLMAEILGRGLSPDQVPAISRTRRRRPPGRPRRASTRPRRGPLRSRPTHGAPGGPGLLDVPGLAAVDGREPARSADREPARGADREPGRSADREPGRGADLAESGLVGGLGSDLGLGSVASGLDSGSGLAGSGLGRGSGLSGSGAVGPGLGRGSGWFGSGSGDAGSVGAVSEAGWPEPPAGGSGPPGESECRARDVRRRRR